MKNIRFDDKRQRDSNNRFAPVDEMVKLFKSTLPKYWIPSKELTVDEMMSPFKGRCPFKCYQPLKPNKYGILARAISDARNSFLLNFEIYIGNVIHQ